MINEEKQIKIEKKLEELIVANNVKEHSKTFFKYQLIFLNGVIASLGIDEVPPIWYICLQSGRSILEERKRLNLNKKLKEDGI